MEKSMKYFKIMLSRVPYSKDAREALGNTSQQPLNGLSGHFSLNFLLRHSETRTTTLVYPLCYKLFQGWVV